MEFPKSFELGDMTVRYVQPAGASGVQLILFPSQKKQDVAARRATITDRPEVKFWAEVAGPQPAGYGRDSLLQVKFAEEPSQDGFSGGVTLFDSPTTAGLRFVSQEQVCDGDFVDIRTVLRHPLGIDCIHHLLYRQGDAGVRMLSEVKNRSDRAVTLELLSSFVLNGITPFDQADAAGRLQLHRFRSWWSAEARLETRTIEELHLERAWVTHGARSERFGQVGSMPVRGFFPFAAVEDIGAGVVWAAKTAWAGSWQMEVVRRGDTLSLTGGLADREFGHWMKRLEPGEVLFSPQALISCSCAGLDDACARLVQMQEADVPDLPVEQDLPIVFNEWCSSWGSPTRGNVLAAARALQGTPVRYFVIDAGWAKRPAGSEILANGDWEVDRDKFPDGLKPVADELRSLGFIPGLWFEFEVCNRGSEAWTRTEHLLHRDGRVFAAGTRRFWDLSDPWVQAFLNERMIGRLKQDGFGYLKVDYNDTLGLGCDHPDSLGEGLRRQILAVQDFFRTIRRELPELVIENCSSGGHRLEPSMMALASMGSFSDAHEGRDIPIIAAGLQRLIPARQSQIWAVLRKEDSMQRLVYSLAAGCLGRLCISGDISALSDEQMQVIRAGLEFYEAVAPVIRCGRSVFSENRSKSWNHPKGWQAVIRRGADRASGLVVVHGFDLGEPQEIAVSLPEGCRRIVRRFSCGEEAQAVDGAIRIRLGEGFTAQAFLLGP